MITTINNSVTYSLSTGRCIMKNEKHSAHFSTDCSKTQHITDILSKCTNLKKKNTI